MNNDDNDNYINYNNDDHNGSSNSRNSGNDNHDNYSYVKDHSCDLNNGRKDIQVAIPKVKFRIAIIMILVMMILTAVI